MTEGKGRVLLVDDETHIRTMIRMVVKGLGHDVVGEAANGAEGVELFKTLKPDIVFLDVNMPMKSGEEALADIMAISPSACVVMLTSVSDMDSVQRCAEKGASNWIRKDTPLPEMKKLIQQTWESLDHGST